MEFNSDDGAVPWEHAHRYAYERLLRRLLQLPSRPLVLTLMLHDTRRVRRACHEKGLRVAAQPAGGRRWRRRAPRSPLSPPACRAQGPSSFHETGEDVLGLLPIHYRLPWLRRGGVGTRALAPAGTACASGRAVLTMPLPSALQPGRHGAELP